MDSIRGSSAEKAIIINEKSSAIGIAEEYLFVQDICGEREIDYVLERQTQISRDGRDYDVLTIRLKDGSSRVLWFDITSFFGKW